jgi:hypothetical protein
MKPLKIASITLFSAFLALFLYANVRRLSMTEQLPIVHLASFELQGELSPREESLLENKISITPGVTACTINKESHTASVTFYPERIDEVTLSLLLADGVNTVKKKAFSAQAGGCPVHELSFLFNQFISTLDLRN